MGVTIQHRRLSIENNLNLFHVTIVFLLDLVLIILAYLFVMPRWTRADRVALARPHAPYAHIAA